MINEVPPLAVHSGIAYIGVNPDRLAFYKDGFTVLTIQLNPWIVTIGEAFSASAAAKIAGEVLEQVLLYQSASRQEGA